MATSTDNPLPTAGIIRRLAALVYDSFLLFAITLAYGAAILAMRIWITDTEAAQTPYTGAQGLLFLAGLWFLLGLFYSWCWRRSGQTLGMKTWRLQLTQLDGARPNWQQCVQRSLLAPPLFALLGIGYLWCLGQPGDCLHDLWTKTRVVVLEKETEKK